MKTPTIAAVLNFVIPGAGLLYLGRRLWAALNLLVATAIVFLLTGHFFGPDRVHYVLLAVAAGSSGLAHSIGIRQARCDSNEESTDGATNNSQGWVPVTKVRTE